MYKFEDQRYYSAGQNTFHRWGWKAQEKVKQRMIPNENGFYNIEVDGGKYWTIGTSKSKYGEFASIDGTIFSVNSAGYMYAKADTEKGEKYLEAMEGLLTAMKKKRLGPSVKIDDEENEWE